MTTRQSRPDRKKTTTKSISVPEDLPSQIQARADEEGHQNFSWVVVQAVREYLARPFRKNQEAA